MKNWTVRRRLTLALPDRQVRAETAEAAARSVRDDVLRHGIRTETEMITTILPDTKDGKAGAAEAQERLRGTMRFDGHAGTGRTAGEREGGGRG